MAENKLSVIQSAQTIEELDKIITKTKELVTEFKYLNETADKLNSLFKSGIPKEYLEAVKKMDDQMAKYTKSLRLIEKLEKEIEDLRSKIDKQEKAREKAKSEKIKKTQLEMEVTRQLNKEERERAKITIQEQKLLQGSISLYNSLEQRMIAHTLRQRDLAVKKQGNIKLTAQEQKEYDKLTKVIHRYDTILKGVDATSGKFQRNVGNYKSGFDPLSNSINQLSREMPAFANSVQTGFMAISNNLPILFDAIGGIRAQNKALVAEGKATIPVWRQIAGSIFSWGTALSIAVTLLTVYGKDMVEFTTKLIKGSEGIDKLKESQDSLNQALKDSEYKKAIKDVSEMRSILKLAEAGVVDKTKALKFYNDGLGQVIGSAKSLNEVENLLAQNAEKYIKATLYKAAANKALDKAAEQSLKAEESRLKTLDDFAKIDLIKPIKDPRNPAAYDYQLKIYNDALAKRKKQEVAIAQKAADDQEKIATDFMEKAAKEAEGLNFDFLFGKEKQAKKAQDNSRKVMRDFLKDLEAWRDEQLAVNERAFVRLERSEEEYLTIAFNINKSFFKQKIAYLKGATAEERKLRAQAMLDLEKNEKEYNANMFRLASESYKKKLDDALYQISRNQKIIQENEQIGENQRNTQLVENIDERIKTQQEYYKSLINSAVKNKQQTIDIEREMFRVLNDLTDERLKLQQSGLDALRKDLDYIQNTLNNEDKLDNIALKRRIMSDNSLSVKQKELELNRVDLKISYDNLKQDQRRLENEKQRIKQNAFGRELTAKELEDISKINLELGEIGLKIDETTKSLDQLDFKYIVKSLQPAVDLITKGFQDMGLNLVADEFSSIYQRILDEGLDFKMSAEDIFKSAMMVVFDFANQLTERSKQQKIAALDEQLKHSQESTELEVSFIQSRIDALNNIQEKTQEQIEERNALEDEARVLKEQQLQREKMIAIQKAKAEQQAAAQTALINGGVAATKTLAEMGFITGLPFAIASIAFSALQAGLIMARNPIPQYYVGTNYAQDGIAWTNERGAEIHTDKYGNIKDYGDNKGARLVKTEKGDKIYTASQTKRILSQISEPNYEEMIFNNSVSPTFVNTRVDEEKLIKGFGKEYEKVAKKYDKPSNFVKDGEMYFQKGSDIPIKIKSSESKVILVKQTKVQRD